MHVKLHPVIELNSQKNLWIVDSENDPLEVENITPGKWDGFALLSEQNDLKGFLLVSQFVDMEDLESYTWMSYDDLEEAEHPRVLFLGKDCPEDLAQEVRTGTLSHLPAKEMVVRNKENVIFKLPPSELVLQVCYGGPSLKIAGIRGICKEDSEEEMD